MSRAEAPLVSVVIPAYNAAWCVGRAVDSVLAQSFRDFELIVVDDGSTDATPAVLGAYAKAIRVVRKVNGGMSSARNAGIDAAGGSLIAFLDSDDYWAPEKLARQLELLNARPGLGFCSTAAALRSPDGRPLGEWPAPSCQDDMLRQIFLQGAAVAGSASAVVVRREVLERAGRFDERLGGLEDTDLWMRLAALAGYACLSEPLTFVTRTPGSVSRNRDHMREAALRILRKNRHLLAPADRGRFWQACYTSVLADYAKWEYRDGLRARALLHLIEGLARAPVARGRLVLGLMRAMLVGQRI